MSLETQNIFTKGIDNYFSRLKDTIDKISRDEINTVLNLLIDAYKNDKLVLTMGNGGSASTASHFVCDFNKGLTYQKEHRFRFICLSDNVATMMAYANDVSYEDIFVEGLKNYLQPDDLVIAISGSGNSPNVIKAVEYTNKNDGITIGLTGYDGGKLKQISQHNIHVPIDDMQITEDLHLIFDHLMMSILDEVL